MIEPVGNEDIYKETEKANNRIWAWIKKNWKSVVVYAIILFQILSLVFGWQGYSIAFGLKTGSDNVKIEFNDFDIDSSNQMEEVDIYSYKPKAPKYLAIHHTAGTDKQTEADLWKVFRERFSNNKPGYNMCISKAGDIITFAAIDGSPYLEYNETVNGVKNFNSVTISIGIIGNEINLNQLMTLRYIWLSMKQKFPQLELTTHRELASKDYNHNGKIDPHERKTQCPGFDRNQFYF